MISHPFILLFYQISYKLNKLLSFFHKKKSEINFAINSGRDPVLENGFIEDQDKGAFLRYGAKSFSYSGCGAAAVYNALRSIGSPAPLPEIIRCFENNGASFFARFGTAPQSAGSILKNFGVQSESTADRKKFRELLAASDVAIFTIMNNRHRLRSMLHIMCIEHKKSPGNIPGALYVHNSHGRLELYRDYDELMTSLGDGGGMADGIYMTGIKKA